MGVADLSNKVALVTGGGGGLGAGISKVLLACGARVAVADLSLEAATKVAAEIGGPDGRMARPFQVDVSVQADAARLVDEVRRELGQIDILVNNAGVHGAPGFADSGIGSREEDWDVTFRVNVKGTVLITEAVMSEMIERRSGKIVNISSHAGRGELPGGSGLLAAPTAGAYAASKAAVILLTQTYAIRLGPHNVNVNCVCPGSIFTPLWAANATWTARNNPAFKGLSPEEVFAKSIQERCPLGRPQTPEDIGNAVAFLASDFAKNITGQALNVNGGQRMN